MTLPAASASALEAIVREQRERSSDGRSRVIGIRAQPTWEVGPLTIDGESVRVVGCTSALAVRAVLAEGGDPDEWLVILTDRDEREPRTATQLPDAKGGILAELVIPCCCVAHATG